jgi:hypothetical protein
MIIPPQAIHTYFGIIGPVWTMGKIVILDELIPFMNHLAVLGGFGPDFL